MIGIPSSNMNVDADASSIRSEHSKFTITSSMIPFSSIVGEKSISKSLFGSSAVASANLSGLFSCYVSVGNVYKKM